MKFSSFVLLLCAVYGENCCKVWKFDIVDLDDWFTFEESYTCTYNPEISQEYGNGWIYTCDDERQLFIARDYWDGIWTIFGTNGLYGNTYNYNENYATYWFYPKKLGIDDWSKCMVNDYQTSLGTGTGYIGYSDLLIQGNNFRCSEEENAAPTTSMTTTKATTSSRSSTTTNTTTKTTTTTTTTTTRTTTTTTTTTTSLASVKTPSEWLALLLTNVESVFDSLDGRTKLYKNWVKRINKFDQRFLKIQKQGCPFADTYQDDFVDLDQSNVCDVS